MDTYSRGQIVVCKEFSGGRIVRVVWDASDSLVFIHDDEQFRLRMSGQPHLEPVGFPRCDVAATAEERPDSMSL